MNRIALFSIAVLAGLIALCALLTALMSTASSLANGIANAASSTALMTSQCVGAFMILVALAGGIVFGISWVNARNILIAKHNRQQQLALPPTYDHFAQLPDDEDENDELSQALVNLLKG